jgi:hypothetical protein
MKKLVLGAAVAASLIAAAPAAAGFMDEMNAADQVERVLDRKFPAYSSVATCRQVSGRKFTCKYTGSKDTASCFHNGRATVRKVTSRRYNARILSRHVSCF